MREVQGNWCFLFVLLVLNILFLTACHPPSDLNRNKYREENSFPQDFKSTIAFLVIERNGKPYFTASGFLIDKEEGKFITAKHFTDDLGSFGPDHCKVFFNGKVYKAVVVKVPPIRDAALIKLISPFSPSEFPEPLTVAANEPKFGEKLFIQGIHLHPYWVRDENRSEGFPDTEINILETYYQQIVKDFSRESKVVFDNLVGKRVKSDPNAVRRHPWLSDAEKKILLQYENSSYIKVRMFRDHKFSFGGLSGGAALNGQGEIVGVVTAQDIFRFEYDEYGLFFDPNANPIRIAEIKKQFFDTIFITPIETLVDLWEDSKIAK